MKDALKRYAKMPSTWRGLALLLGAFGIAIEPQMIEAVAAGVTAVIGIIETARKD